MSSFTSILRHRWPAILVAALVMGWIFWLRAPSWQAKIWNVDESIHAAVADVILDGGVIYRDAIDQRTPLSYYVFAAVFSVAGNSLFAVRVVIAAMIGLTALLLGAAVRRRHDGLTALLAMVAYGAMSSQLLYPADTFAANTEWFVGLFSAAAAACFWLGREALPSARRCFWTGMLLAGSVLSKQSALLEVAAPILALWGALTVGRLSVGQSLLRTSALVAGFLGPVLLTLAALAAAGAWDDFWFYAWNYNIQFYGPEIAFPDKIASAAPWILAIWTQYPVLCLVGAATGVALIWRALQARPTDEMRENRAVEFYLLAWCALSLGGAMSGGRGFDHYFIVCLAPFSWAAARGTTIALNRVSQWIAPSSKRRTVTWVFGAILFAAPAVWHARLAREVVIQPDDPSYRILDVVTKHSGPDDPIFVWGFNADVYTLAHRSPASRFIYCSFQTGLIPWTNIAPEIDTSYAIVPHAMDDLLTDLDRTRPRVLVDASWLTYRGFVKYPLKNFPRLNDWIDRHYVEFDPVRLRKLGFAVHLRREDIASLPPPFAPGPSERVRLEVPELVSPGLVEVGIVGESDHGPVTGLALTRGEELIAAVRIGGFPSANILVPILVDAAETSVPLQCWIRHGDGNWQPGPTRTPKVALISVTPEQATDFALPWVTDQLPSTGVRALLGPRVDRNEDQRSYALHAPSLLRYELPAGINRVSGSYSIPPGAYAPENQHPTDGAVFIVTIRFSDGSAQELYRRAIDPGRYPEHRSAQPFNLALPMTEDPRVLEFEITPGPAGDASSDWTQWNDIRLETSP